ncbi:MAG: hypothetical protein DHS20C11_29150 [Lysobacteraceae bacterium]|nr:MAG: hypothetical protein DHS20C11_29150 [Xanthomonadaceae bacterium]
MSGHHPLKTLCALLFAGPALATVSVGTSPGAGTCDFTTISDAINALPPGGDQIRVLNNQVFNEDLFIDQNVDIVGGFDTCDDTNTNTHGSARTQIVGSSLGPVVSIDSPAIIGVRLANVWIQGGDGGSGGGGGVRVNARGALYLTDALLLANSAQNGGGLYVTNADAFDLDVFIQDTDIAGNTAGLAGGGIYCSGNVNMMMDEESTITGNSATNGGGVLVEDFCFFSSFAGIDSNDSAALVGIMNNSATQSGGGIHARLRGQALLSGAIDPATGYGLAGQPVSVSNNSAGEKGGGIFVTGNSSHAFVRQSQFYSNHAGLDGGAIAVDDNGTLIADDSGACWRQTTCNTFEHNSADRWGGGIAIADGGGVALNDTAHIGNRADLGAAIYMRDETSLLYLDGNVLYQNGNFGSGQWADQYLVRVFGGLAQLRQTTIADNDVTTATLGVSDGGGAADVSILNSILLGQGLTPVSYIGMPTTNNDCLLVDEQGQLTGTIIFSVDPQFVDRANANYHLSAVSPGIDMCSDSGGPRHDYEAQSRGWDDPTIGNVGGAFDVGADESYLSDTVFASGFGEY